MLNKEKFLLKKVLSNQFIFTILGLIIVVLISIPLAKNVSKQYRVNKEIESLKNEIDSLSNKNSQLKNLIGYMESDQFIEENARLNLNYKRPGENVMVVKDSEIQDTNIIENKNKGNGAKSDSNIKKWIRYFSNNKL